MPTTAIAILGFLTFPEWQVPFGGLLLHMMCSAAVLGGSYVAVHLGWQHSRRCLRNEILWAQLARWLDFLVYCQVALLVAGWTQALLPVSWLDGPEAFGGISPSLIWLTLAAGFAGVTAIVFHQVHVASFAFHCLAYPPAWFAAVVVGAAVLVGPGGILVLFGVLLAGFVVNHRLKEEPAPIVPGAILPAAAAGTCLLLVYLAALFLQSTCSIVVADRIAASIIMSAGITGVSIASVFVLLGRTLSLQKGMANLGRPTGVPEAPYELSDEAFLQWLQQEEPITDVSADLFRMRYAAERLATTFFRLQPGAPNVVLHGRQGSGKSSIVKMARCFTEGDEAGLQQFRMRQYESWEDEPRPSFLFVQVDSWGLNRNTVVEYLLKNMIAELGRHVDCLALRGIPQAYAAAMRDSVPNWLKGVWGLAVCSPEPNDLVEHIAGILTAINARMVVVLEDLERNGEEDEIDSLHRIFDYFDSVPRISFVWARSHSEREREYA